MTDNYRKDFTAGIPLQITKHISRMVSGCLLAVGGTMNEVNSLIIANLFAANGSYLVWDYDRKISEATKGIMETKGYKIYEIDALERKKYNSCIELIVRKPKMFFDDKEYKKYLDDITDLALDSDKFAVEIKKVNEIY